jgi:hypothetical protein
MRKSTIILLAAAAATALLSCTKEQGTRSDADGRPVDFNVSIHGAPPTKATGTTYADESRVSDLQVFVFDEDGTLQDYKAVGAAMTATLSATSGVRTVWAVVNAPSMSDVTSLSQLEQRATLLSDNSPDALVMTGSVTQEIVDGGTVPITVRRIVSRVSVAKISSDFKYGLEGKSVSIDAIYLINVAADNDYAVSLEGPVNWVNRLGHEDTTHDALLFDSLSGVNVSNGNPYSAEHAFYPYPNPVETETYDAVWAPRHTMLVIEVTIDGQRGYYPIELPVLERNKTYSIEEVVLTRRPGDVPYKPIETGEATAQITVSEWELGLNLGTITI